jgi:hypothetical protein
VPGQVIPSDHPKVLHLLDLQPDEDIVYFDASLASQSWVHQSPDEAILLPRTIHGITPRVVLRATFVSDSNCAELDDELSNLRSILPDSTRWTYRLSQPLVHSSPSATPSETPERKLEASKALFPGVTVRNLPMKYANDMATLYRHLEPIWSGAKGSVEVVLAVCKESLPGANVVYSTLARHRRAFRIASYLGLLDDFVAIGHKKGGEWSLVYTLGVLRLFPLFASCLC